MFADTGNPEGKAAVQSVEADHTPEGLAALIIFGGAVGVKFTSELAMHDNDGRAVVIDFPSTRPDEAMIQPMPVVDADLLMSNRQFEDIAA